MLVRDALVSNPFVVRPSTTMFELIEGILGCNQTTASVVEGDMLVGMVSAIDVMRQLLPSYVAMDENLAGVLHATFFEEALDKLRDVLVGDVMQRECHVLRDDAVLMRAVAMLVKHDHKTMPVVDGRSGRYVGSVTRRSVLRLMRSSLDK